MSLLQECGVLIVGIFPRFHDRSSYFVFGLAIESLQECYDSDPENLALLCLDLLVLIKCNTASFLQVPVKLSDAICLQHV